MKKYLNKNVYEATQERLNYIFSEFDNILVSFSGGKDSGLLLNLCLDYANKHKMQHKLALYHLDYEAQYEMTTQYVERTFEKLSYIKRFWLCLPIGADCGVEMTSGTWIPWEKSKKHLWCRSMPNYSYIINENNAEFPIISGQQDYEVQDIFCKWFSRKYGTTAVMIGIRTDESLNRFRAIVSDKKVHVYKQKKYIVGYGDEVTFKCYPIYDWNVQDIWIANAKFTYDYNKLYDLYYQAGLPIEQMRVANPFHSCGTDSLKLYKAIEPNTWGKLLSRVNGVSFAGIYGGTTAMGWKSITLPAGHTWKSYCHFLLNTLDDKTREHYKEKLKTSIAFWKERGGVVSEQTLEELKGIDGITNKGKICKTSNKDVITFDDYPDNLDVTDFREVPTYKRMCVCILKNDYFCKYMGFAPTKQEVEKKRKTLEMYRGL